jgi:hypothetical protein
MEGEKYYPGSTISHPEPFRSLKVHSRHRGLCVYFLARCGEWSGVCGLDRRQPVADNTEVNPETPEKSRLR